MNYVEFSKKFAMSWKPSAEVKLISALGASGPKLESFRLEFSNPIHTREFTKLSFLLRDYKGFSIRQKTCHMK